MTFKPGDLITHKHFNRMGVLLSSRYDKYAALNMKEPNDQSVFCYDVKWLTGDTMPWQKRVNEKNIALISEAQ